MTSKIQDVSKRLNSYYITTLLNVLTPDYTIKGKCLYSTCPMCKCQKKDAFRWHGDKNVGYCLECERGGDMIAIISVVQDMSPLDAAEDLDNYMNAIDTIDSISKKMLTNSEGVIIHLELP